jgi:hypothetical protein
MATEVRSRECRRDGICVENSELSTRGAVTRANQALEQTRDNVLRYGESVGCELLNFFVLP